MIKETPPHICVDKTSHLKTFLKRRAVKLFRPKKFGKTTVLGLLQAMCKADPGLFEGTSIAKELVNGVPFFQYLGKRGYPLPCLKIEGGFDVALGNWQLSEQLLMLKLRRFSQEYGIRVTESHPSMYFISLVRELYDQMGKKLVLLIDDYEVPLLFGNDEVKSKYRSFLDLVLGQFKDSSMAELIVVTGVESLPELGTDHTNYLRNVSHLPEFAEVCGFTQQEVESACNQMQFYRNYSKTEQERFLRQLEVNYGGFNFAHVPSPAYIYNPLSVMRCLEENGNIASYWNEAFQRIPESVKTAARQNRLNYGDIRGFFPLQATPQDLDLLQLAAYGLMTLDCFKAEKMFIRNSNLESLFTVHKFIPEYKNIINRFSHASSNYKVVSEYAGEEGKKADIVVHNYLNKTILIIEVKQLEFMQKNENELQKMELGLNEKKKNGKFNKKNRNAEIERKMQELAKTVLNQIAEKGCCSDFFRSYPGWEIFEMALVCNTAIGSNRGLQVKLAVVKTKAGAKGTERVQVYPD